MTIDDTFYTYDLITPVRVIVKNIELLPGDVFYVGKGRGKRLAHHNKKSQRTYNELKNTVITRISEQNEKYIAKIHKNNLTEKEAFALEIKRIDELGRIIDGTGKLTNLTSGGEGSSGRKLTEKNRTRLAEWVQKNGPYNKGIKRPGIGGRPKGIEWTDEQKESRSILMNSAKFKEKNKESIDRRTKILVESRKIKKPISPKGKVWITNGKIDTYVYADNIPDGFILGRGNKNLNKSKRGKCWCTDGIMSKQFDPNDIPTGWTKGRIIKKVK